VAKSPDVELHAFSFIEAAAIFRTSFQNPAARKEKRKVSSTLTSGSKKRPGIHVLLAKLCVKRSEMEAEKSKGMHEDRII
jgi:hypothetical protein